MDLFIDIIEGHSGIKLYRFPISKEKEAYQQAAKLEEMGLYIKLVFPSLTLSLGKSLGVTEKDIPALKLELDKEIKNH